MYIEERARKLVDLGIYAKANQELNSYPVDGSLVPHDQYILRMMIRGPKTEGYVVPNELKWIEPMVIRADAEQRKLGVNHPYVYVTVRCGPMKSVSDDVWHVDGFSMRVPHVTEQNYIWSDHTPTEILKQNFAFPSDFHPMVYNIHQFFQDRALDRNVEQLEAWRMYQLDVYNVHRRPRIEAGTPRRFFRISFVPIEIESDDCQPNPLLPARVYNRDDVRKRLIRYV